MTALVGLLRAVNVGGRKVLMAELREALAAAGFADVRTLVQTGNVVVATPLEPPAAGVAMEAAIGERFGIDVSVIVRTPAELAAVAATDPFAGAADAEPAKRLVVFFAEPPDPAPLAGLDLAPERAVVAGRELHLWCPDGVGRSPMLARGPVKKLAAGGTARNWNTVLKLRDLAGG